MKTLLTFALALLSLSVASLGQTPQGNALRATNGSGYNSTFYGPVSVADYVNATNSSRTNTFAGLIQQGGFAHAQNSAAFGLSTTSTASGAFVTGIGNHSAGGGSLMGGRDNVAGSGAAYSFVVGRGNSVFGLHNFAIGSGHEVDGGGSGAIGVGSTFQSGATNSIAIGTGIEFAATASNTIAIVAGQVGLSVPHSNSFIVHAPAGSWLLGGPIGGNGANLTNLSASAVTVSMNPGEINLLGANGTNRFLKATADTDAARGVVFTNALAQASAGDTLILGPGTYNVQASRFITNTLVFQSGAMLKPASGVTLTNDGRQVAEPSQQIYDLSDGGAISLVRNFTMDTVYFDWFGAKGNNGQNGVTAPDCSAAIMAAWTASVQPPQAVTDGGLPASLNSHVIAHSPFIRKLRFGISSGVYVLDNPVSLTSAWWPVIDGNNAMLVGNNQFGNTNGMITFGDVYELLISDLNFKAVEARQQKWGVAIENSAGSVLPSRMTMRSCSFMGNRKGFKYGVWIRPGSAGSNNEGHTFENCVFLDHERYGILVSESQTYAIQVVNCAFNGAPGQQYDGWAHVSGFDPEEYGQAAFGGFQIRGGHGGGGQGACFLFPASGRPNSVIGFDNEDTSRFVWSGSWYPVTNLNFTFKAAGDDLSATNLNLALFAKGNTNVITLSSTNTYTANRRTFEYVDANTNLTRIAVTYAQVQPFQPSTGEGTLFAVVETDADGVTNIIRTGGSGEGFTAAPAPLIVQGCSINYTYCWDGRLIGIYNGPANITGNRIRQFGTQKVKAMVSVVGQGFGYGGVEFHGNGYLDLDANGPTNMLDRIYIAGSDGSRLTNGYYYDGSPVEPTKICTTGNTLYDNTGQTNKILGEYCNLRADTIQRGTFTIASLGDVTPLAATNTGTADSFRVDDEAADSTPTTITAAGTFRPGGGITMPVGGGDGISLGGANYSGDYNSIDSSGGILLRYANGDDLRIFNQTTTKAILGDAGWMIIPPIISTNTATANTALTLNGAASGANGIVAGYDTNGVNKWKIENDGDFTSTGSVNASTSINAGSVMTSPLYRGPSSAAFTLGSTTTPTITVLATNVLIGSVVTATNGFIVNSNSFLATPTLAEGDNWYFSSNGIPHVSYRYGGATTTVRLVP